MISKVKSGLMQLMNSLENADKITSASKNTNLFDYKRVRSDYYQKSVEISLHQIEENKEALLKLDNGKKIVELINHLQNNMDVDYIANILALIKESDIEKEKTPLFKKPKGLPDEIRDEIYADLNELEKCYSSECYRSCVILCGRILETALHRKHYDATGKDLLEKAPGTGLGKVIAFLKEANVSMDPAISQQIHLVNQTRIFSVHVKKEVFNPSPEQTQAIVLYTVDILSKLF